MNESNQRLLTVAQGYVELGMFLDANEELENISPDERHLPEVLAIRIDIYHGLQKWELMRTVARQLAIDQPDNPQWFTCWAQAARHAESVDAARLVLLNAVESLPGAAVVQYNLACYECLLGEIEVAKARLGHAFKLNSKLRLAALDDPDLRTLWDSLAGPSGESLA